jgi:hypothetical protein
MRKHLPTASDVKMGLIGAVIAIIIIGTFEIRAATPSVAFQETHVRLTSGWNLVRIYDRDMRVACYRDYSSNVVSCVRVGD